MALNRHWPWRTSIALGPTTNSMDTPGPFQRKSDSTVTAGTNTAGKLPTVSARHIADAITNSRKPGERPPAPRPDNGADDLIAHLGSDPVHQGSRTCPRSDQQLGARLTTYCARARYRRDDGSPVSSSEAAIEKAPALDGEAGPGGPPGEWGRRLPSLIELPDLSGNCTKVRGSVA